jgi:hypothetical protein
MTRIEGILSDEENRAIANENAREMFRKFVAKRPQEDNLLEAQRQFFMKETDFLGFIAQTQLIPGQGIPENIYVGKYKHHSYGNLYVRMGEKITSLALFNSLFPYFFDVRLDCKNEKGFFYGVGGRSVFSLDGDYTIEEAIKEVRPIVSMIEGYEKIVTAKRFDQKKEIA